MKVLNVLDQPVCPSVAANNIRAFGAGVALLRHALKRLLVRRALLGLCEKFPAVLAVVTPRRQANVFPQCWPLNYAQD